MLTRVFFSANLNKVILILQRSGQRVHSFYVNMRVLLVCAINIIKYNERQRFNGKKTGL